ncbi:MAG: thioredoxin domain-containing protein [Waddliaceae bacterium]
MHLSRTKWWIVTLALIAGIILTIISTIGLCTAECAENENWRLFGLPFELFGFVFFAAATTLHLLSWKYPALWKWTAILAFSGVGAEITMIWIQHAKIGAWCPVCLSIAGTIFFIAAIFLSTMVNQLKLQPKGNFMKVYQMEIRSLAALILGFLATFFGAAQVDAFQEISDNITENIAFGNKDTDIEGYLFTDWACPACRKIEPGIEQIKSAVTKEGKFYFIDHAVHPETLNYIPYNLSAMVNHKPYYIQFRHMLTKLSTQTPSPTADQIKALANTIGIDFRKLDYSNISMGIRNFKELGKKFKVKGTPTLVLVNKKTKQGKRLTGSDDITPEKIKAAIQELKQ